MKLKREQMPTLLFQVLKKTKTMNITTSPVKLGIKFFLKIKIDPTLLFNR